MKLTALLLLNLFNAAFVNEQVYKNNFHTEQGEIINGHPTKILVWQKTFQTNFDKKEVLQNIKERCVLKNSGNDTDRFAGKIFLTRSDIDYQSAGYRSANSIGPFLSLGDVNALLTISFDKKQYTVIVRDIVSVLTENSRGLGKKGKTVDIE